MQTYKIKGRVGDVLLSKVFFKLSKQSLLLTDTIDKILLVDSWDAINEAIESYVVMEEGRRAHTSKVSCGGIAI